MRESTAFSGMTLSDLSLGEIAISERCYRAGSALDWHDHELANFSFVLAGGYVEALPGRQRECPTGTLVVHPEGERHADVHGSDDVRLLTVSLQPCRSDGVHPLGRLLDESREIHAPHLNRLGSRLARIVRAGGAGTALIAEGLVLEVLGEIAALPNKDLASRPAWLDDVLERIRADPGTDHAIAYLARDAGVHPIHMVRTFRRYQGCTIGEFVRDARITWAHERLCKSELGLVEIALGAGFSDQSHFSRVFKSAFGLPPARYRREWTRRSQ